METSPYFERLGSTMLNSYQPMPVCSSLFSVSHCSVASVTLSTSLKIISLHISYPFVGIYMLPSSKDQTILPNCTRCFHSPVETVSLPRVHCENKCVIICIVDISQVLKRNSIFCIKFFKLVQQYGDSVCLACLYCFA